MLHFILAAGFLGWVAVAQDNSLSPSDSLLHGLLFDPQKTHNSGIFNNHQRPHNIQHGEGSTPRGEYQPLVGGSRDSRGGGPHIEGSILPHGPPEPFDKSSNSNHDPFTPDRRDYLSGTQGRPHASPVHPSSGPLDTDPQNRQPFHSGRPGFDSGNVHNNRFPENHNSPYRRRLAHPQQRALQRVQPFGNFAKKSPRDDSFDLLSPISPIQGSHDSFGSTRPRTLPYQRSNPYTSQHSQPSQHHDPVYGNDKNKQYSIPNNQYPQGYVPARVQPTPPYGHNAPNPTPTYTPSQSAQFPTDNHDSSRPNPPTPSIPKFGESLAPPPLYVPTHKHNRNNGPHRHNDLGYHGPGNAPGIPYQQNPNSRHYPGGDTGHSQQNPSYVPHQNQGYSDHNQPDQSPDYTDRNPHQNQQYPPPGPHQSQQYQNPPSQSHPTSDQNQGHQYPSPTPDRSHQYVSPNSNQGDKYVSPSSNYDPDPRGNEHHVDHKSSDSQYPGSSVGQPQRYPGNNAQQYLSTPPKEDKYYPNDDSHQGLPHHQDQPYSGSNPHEKHGYPSDSSQPYQQGQKQPHQPVEGSYPVETHKHPDQNQYLPNQGTQPSHSEYTGPDQKPVNQYNDHADQQPALNHHPDATINPDEQYNPSGSDDHSKRDSYPPQHVNDPGSADNHNAHPNTDYAYNKNPNGDKINNYPSHKHEGQSDLSQTSAQYPGPHSDHSNHVLDSSPIGPSYPPAGDTAAPKEHVANLNDNTKPTDYPGNTDNGNAFQDNPSPYPEKATINNNNEHSSYSPEKSSHPGSDAHEYPGSYPDKSHSNTDEHPTSYQDKTTPEVGAELSESYPGKSSHRNSDAHELPGSYPNKHSGTEEHPKSYSDKATPGAEQPGPYQDSSSNLDSGKHDYSGSYPEKVNFGIDGHQTPYPDKATHQVGAEHAEKYPHESSHPGNDAHEYPGSYPDKTHSDAHPTSHPGGATHEVGAEHAGSHSGSDTQDYPSSYPGKNPSGTDDHPTSYPDKTDSGDHPSYPDNAAQKAGVDNPISYPDTTSHSDSDKHDYPQSNDDKTHSSTDEHPTSYPDKATHLAGAEHAETYPGKSAHPGSDKLDYPGSNPDKTHSDSDVHSDSHPITGTSKESGSYPPVSVHPEHPITYPDTSAHHDTDNSVHPDSHSNTATHDGYPGSYPDTHSDPTHDTGSYPDKNTHQGKADNIYPYSPKITNSHIDPYPPKATNPHLDSYPPKGTNSHLDSYPPKGTNSHLDSYPPKGTNTHIDPFPPKASNPGSSEHADSYPNVHVPGYHLPSEHDIPHTDNDVYPKHHVHPHNIHSKFPRNKYPDSVKLTQSYPPVNAKAGDDSIDDDNHVNTKAQVIPESHPTVIENPVSQAEASKVSEHEVVKPSTPFIPPGLQGQCFRYKDLSAGYKLSDNTYGYPEDEITAEIRARPFLAPILGFKNLAKQRNQFDINGLGGLGGFDRNTQSTNDYLFTIKDYPSGYKEGDFKAPTPRDYSCRMTSIPLRMFKLYGGSCWAVNPDFKKVTYKQCSAPGDYCSSKRGRCSEDYDWVEVWSYCERAPEGQRTKPRKLYLPVGCSCKSYYC